MAQFQSSPGMGAGRNVSRRILRGCRPRFQSSPGMGAGRNMSMAQVMEAACRFQSSPGMGAGRNLYFPAKCLRPYWLRPAPMPGED